MTDPVLVEVTRGGTVESRHRGAVAVVDAAGRVVYAAGDVARPVFPRSTVKAFQALPLVESGAADRFGFGDAELALAIASHNGEPRHVATARWMLAAAGLHEGCLECGPQWPGRGVDLAVLHRMGARSSRIHNNCSGKHAGFLCTAVATGVDPAGYVRPDHPVMQEIVAAVEAVTGAQHGLDNRAIDGCSIPTYAIPLTALARGFARLATGSGLPAGRARAGARLIAAAAAEPFMVAGTGSFCTAAIRILGRDAYVKTGAEGVYVAAFPGLGLGAALKIEDGATRAAEVAIAAVAMALLAIVEDDPRHAPMMALLRPDVLSRKGETVGRMGPDAAFMASLPSGRKG